jgi:two-component system chemotaxis response regulator CheB
MNGETVRVLVVEDSAFARKVLRESLARRPNLEVVGIAHDGLEALEKIDALGPDVITVDLVMPHLDGLGLLRALRGRAGAPRAVVVSTADGQSELVLSALEAGAVDFVHKPTSLATDRLYEISEDLGLKVQAAAIARPQPLARALPRIEAPTHGPAARSHSGGSSAPLVVLGTSTGGPQALTHLISQLPVDFPSPVAAVLHIPAGYTEALARRLDQQSALEVVEATDRLELRPGRVVLARAGVHLKVSAGQRGLVTLDPFPADTAHRPSVDVLFESAAAAWGPEVVGVVLTGMGNDGLAGARAIRAAGGKVVTEHPSTCVIYGMPRAVQEAGLSNVQVPLDELALALTGIVRRGQRRISG